MAIFFNKSPLKYWFVLIFAPPGNGKSLEQARLSDLVFKEYDRTERKYPQLPHRILMSNQHLAPKLAIKRAESGHYVYWEEPDQFRYCPRKVCWKGDFVHRIHDVDIFIDEGATLFPADGWADTPIWLRKMWAQHRHNGIRIVMLTQAYENIDINARRMVWQAYYMHKIIGSRDVSATLPPLVKWSLLNVLDPSKNVIWGVYSKRRFDPMIMKSDPMAMLTIQLSEKKSEDLKKLKLIGGSEIHFISWRKVNLYDTTQDVKEYEVKREIEHIEVKCSHVNCQYIHKTHKLK